jgi:hypothetical protein
MTDGSYDNQVLVSDDPSPVAKTVLTSLATTSNPIMRSPPYIPTKQGVKMTISQMQSGKKCGGRIPNAITKLHAHPSSRNRKLKEDNETRETQPGLIHECKKIVSK